ncbi:hypothetical protein AGMMS50225_08320 [Betaproteobacteria bacterium]|nr:hypothetical protein AGMMS50225_08320 [Betaproteobacteria bacterium]
MANELETQLHRIRQHLLGSVPHSIVERGIRHFEREEIQQALACLSAAVEQRSGDPRAYAYLAFICAKQGLEREAADFITRALELDPAQQAWQAALGESFLKAGNAAAAARHLQLAVDARPDMYAAYPALAESYRRLNDYERALRLLEQAPEHALTLELLNEIRAEAAMYARNPNAITRRAALLPYCTAPELDREAPVQENTPIGPIWQYWGQGEGAAMPAIVRASLASVKRHCGARQVIVLDDTTVDAYVQIPACIRKIQHTRRAHFSDWLRTALLAQYGGTWVDATVFFSGPIDEDILRAAFFLYHWPPSTLVNKNSYLISNWFIHAIPHHPIIEGLKLVLEKYWAQNEEALDYFIFHYLFEALVTLHPGLRRQWQEARPRISSLIPHELFQVLLEPFDPAQFAAITAHSNIHKLTYRLDEFKRPYHTFRDEMETR